MKIDKNWIGLGVMLLIMGIGAYSSGKLVEHNKRQAVEWREEFDRKIEMAKTVTGEPCSPVVFEMIVPNSKLGLLPQLVVMGQVVDSHVSESYELRSNGQVVELWVQQPFGQGYKGKRDRKKIAEKVSDPTRNKLCELK